MNINEYIASLEETRKGKILKIVQYIMNQYPYVDASMDYAPKTKFPTFKFNNQYVMIASMKNYISIHFSNYEVIKDIASIDKRIKTGVGCVKINDHVTFPVEEIKQAIIKCFS